MSVGRTPSLEAVILLRNATINKELESEVSVYNGDLQFPKLGKSFPLSLQTELVCEVDNTAISLEQLYDFVVHYNDNFGEYIMHFSETFNTTSNLTILDCSHLYAFFHGKSNTIAGLEGPIPDSIPPSPPMHGNNYANDNTSHSMARHDSASSFEFSNLSHAPSASVEIGHEYATGVNGDSMDRDTTSRNASTYEHINRKRSKPDSDTISPPRKKHRSNDFGMEAQEGETPFWRSLPDPQPLQEYLDCRHADATQRIQDSIDWESDYRSQIREDMTRNSILKSKNKKSFKHFAGEVKKIAQRIRKLKSNPSRAQEGSYETPEDIERKQRTQRPIIVVPCSLQTLLNTDNATRFLKNGEFVIPSSAGEKNKRIVIAKKSRVDPAREAQFEVINEPRKDDWDRIAAIFVLGKSWQFKQWHKPWNKPEHIFDKCKGFYMRYDDATPNQNVAKWRVKELVISKSRRHEDAKVVNQFWKDFYKHLAGARYKKMFY